MISRSIPFAAMALCLGVWGCSSPDSSEASDPAAATNDVTGSSPVENVRQYDSCRNDGHSGSLKLGNLNPAGDPGMGATFETANCIVGRLTKFNGKFRPYDLQSFKKGPNGQTFFFKRVSDNTIGEAPAECLKIKLSVAVGPTDAFVSIDRVKQLPAPRADGLCADNGET